MTTNNRYLIKTPDGFVPFAGIAESEHEYITTLTFTNGKSIKCSDNHVLWTVNNKEIKVRDITTGDKLKSEKEPFIVHSKISKKHKKNLYDIIEVDNENNSFLLENTLLSHNCQFLSFEKILIDAEQLDFLQTAEVYTTINGFDIYKEKLEHPDSMIIVSIDPSAGGDDSSVIELWEITPKKIHQLGVCADPDMDASFIFDKILWLHEFFKKQWNYEPMDSMIMFERNGVGEGLSQILTTTEKASEYLEMPIYYDNKGAGIAMTPPMKKKLALQFKNLVEYNKLQINDPEMINELYGFIRQSNGNYSAKSGYNDDRVMSCFLLVHYLMNVFAEYADGDFSIDNMMLVDRDERLVVSNESIDPVEKYQARLEVEQKEKELQEKIKKDLEAERNHYATLAQMGSSVVEEDDDDIDLDDYDIVAGVF